MSSVQFSSGMLQARPRVVQIWHEHQTARSFQAVDVLRKEASAAVMLQGAKLSDRLLRQTRARVRRKFHKQVAKSGAVNILVNRSNQNVDPNLADIMSLPNLLHCKHREVKPLGVGETLGCTSPNAGDVDAAGHCVPEEYSGAQKLSSSPAEANSGHV